MNISENQLVELLKEKGMRIIIAKDKIYHDYRIVADTPLYSYEGISLISNKWSLCIFDKERSNGEMEVLKQFSSKEEAITYWFIRKIYRFFMDSFVIPSRNREIKNWTVNTVVEEMKRIGIPLTYLSYGDKVNKNSILFSKENDKWLSGYVNHKEELVFKTNNGTSDDNWYLSLFGNRIYTLYLFDLYTEELNKREINIKKITDQERLILLGYE